MQCATPCVTHGESFYVTEDTEKAETEILFVVAALNLLPLFVLTQHWASLGFFSYSWPYLPTPSFNPTG